MSRNGARPKSRPKMFREESGGHDSKMAKLLDDLSEFQEYQTILKELRKDIKKGFTEAQLAKKYAPMAQARIISDMLTTNNPTAALAAAKDLLDRANGKATEKQEITHRLEKLSDQELDALIQSEEQELEEMHNKFKQ